MAISFVHAPMAYVVNDDKRPRFYANDHSRDTVRVVPVGVDISDGRLADCQLDIEGFQLFRFPSSVRDFHQLDQVGGTYSDEVQHWLKDISGADEVVMSSGPLLRFSERSDLSGASNNSRPARFAHVDVSEMTAKQFSERSAPKPNWRRCVHFNVWRVITPPPQDVPLAFCDRRTVAAGDLIPTDAIFDHFDQPEWSFEAWTIASNPDHQWVWFSDMTTDEAVVFVTHDSDKEGGGVVPHCAFDAPNVTDDVLPRGSVEIRASAYWY